MEETQKMKKNIHVVLIALKGLGIPRKNKSLKQVEEAAGQAKNTGDDMDNPLKTSLGQQIKATSPEQDVNEEISKIYILVKIDKLKAKTDLISCNDDGLFVVDSFFKFTTSMFIKKGAIYQPKLIDIRVLSEQGTKLGSINLPLNSLTTEHMEPAFKPLGGVAEFGEILFNCYLDKDNTINEGGCDEGTGISSGDADLSQGRRKSTVSQGILKGSNTQCSRKVSTPFALSNLGNNLGTGACRPTPAYIHPTNFTIEPKFHEVLETIDVSKVEQLDCDWQPAPLLFKNKINCDIPNHDTTISNLDLF